MNAPAKFIADSFYDVIVVGGGFAAAEESVFLTKFAHHVTILIREEDFTCAKSVADQTRSNDKITEFRAEANDSFGVFVFAGYVPATALAKGIADLNEQGYILTDSSQRTTADGLYAAGDMCETASSGDYRCGRRCSRSNRVRKICSKNAEENRSGSGTPGNGSSYKRYRI